ncbi:MAG: DUF177 domain-containing protein [FCB group bacterium]|nr:DUF177 domain-containing protein [FCB group bacterium]
MILDLREFETFPAHAVLKGNLSNYEFRYDLIHRINEVELFIDIQKSGEEYFCQGKIISSVVLECARCLEEFEKELESATDFIICAQEWHEKNSNDLDNEDYVYFKSSDLHVDLSDIVRQSIILAESMKPLCSENCKGLCPQCGINLNEESCSCNKEIIDSRWEGLMHLSHVTKQRRENTDAAS